ncbi:MAG: class IV adenylate cyclase [Planctomycetia bacterium]
MNPARCNIERKARLGNPAAARATAERLGAKFAGVLRQTDVYFHAPAGRLKLRETLDADGRLHAELIAYQRSDAVGLRPSGYMRVPTDRPDDLKQALAAALGVHGVVRKERTLYLVGTVRIHLDAVVGRGDFLEFEAVLPEGADIDGPEAAAARAMLAELSAVFGLTPDDDVAGSYGDDAVPEQ